MDLISLTFVVTSLLASGWQWHQGVRWRLLTAISRPLSRIYRPPYMFSLLHMIAFMCDEVFHVSISFTKCAPKRLSFQRWLMFYVYLDVFKM